MQRVTSQNNKLGKHHAFPSGLLVATAASAPAGASSRKFAAVVVTFEPAAAVAGLAAAGTCRRGDSPSDPRINRLAAVFGPALASTTAAGTVAATGNSGSSCSPALAVSHWQRKNEEDLARVRRGAAALRAVR